ncbi:MAG: GTPase domain-containing protein [Actinobacteria bacterium]|nr:GTPase domain-containing protein [Actinomycetota bacterium]
MTFDDWRVAVLDAIGALVGAEQAAKVGAEWDEHVARGKAEVTFVGPYSSGKSSLLRRLVVDGGGEIPDWLTVSARPETFELNAVDVGDLTFTDAPGFGAGNELHDELAQDALALSDAFLLVVPPQLLTTYRELVGSILSGGYFFGEARTGGEQVVIAVIAQADSMGIDPEDDIEGMRRLADRKRSELIAQLEGTAGIALPHLPVFCVAADPYEEQSRRTSPQPADFDPYRAWDGIDALSSALDGLASRYDELLVSAGVRYFQRVGNAVAARARAVVDDLRASAEELQARHTDWEHQKSRVDAVVAAARTDLRSHLVAIASELGDEVGSDEREARARIDERMSTTVERWGQRWDGELDLLLGEAGAHVDERLGRARARRTDEFLRSLSARSDAPEPPRANSRIVDLLNNINAELHGSARSAIEVFAGTSIDKLLAMGQKDTAAKAAAAANEVSHDANEVSQKFVKNARTLTGTLEVVDGVLAVVTIIDAERRQQAADAERRRARAEAQQRVEDSATKASIEIVEGDDAAPGWRARADAALAQLRQQLGLTTDDTAIKDLLATVAAKQDQVDALRRLLSDSP